MIKKDQMRKIFKRYGSIIIPDIGKKNSAYPIYIRLKSLKRLSKYIPFPCEFDDKGICNCPVEFIHDKHNIMCCCRYCAETAGYLNIVPEQDIWSYAKAYNTETGFWRKGKGCILSRELRSKTCLSYYCDSQYSSKVDDFNDELYAYGKAIESVEREYKREIELLKYMKKGKGD